MRFLLALGFAVFATFTAPTLADSPKPDGRWHVSVELSPVDDSETVMLRIVSKAQFTDRFGRKKWGVLSIGCVENSTILTIWPGGEFVAANGDFGYITYRIDKKKAEKKFMAESTDNQFLGLWHGLGIDLIREIASGNTLFVRITPFNEASH
jgi:type VI secretion system protein VasI